MAEAMHALNLHHSHQRELEVHLLVVQSQVRSEVALRDKTYLDLKQKIEELDDLKAQHASEITVLTRKVHVDGLPN